MAQPQHAQLLRALAAQRLQSRGGSPTSIRDWRDVSRQVARPEGMDDMAQYMAGSDVRGSMRGGGKLEMLRQVLATRMARGLAPRPDPLGFAAIMRLMGGRGADLAPRGAEEDVDPWSWPNPSPNPRPDPGPMVPPGTPIRPPRMGGY